MKKSAFIDRDGMVLEPEGYQLDSLDKLEFYQKLSIFG
jgi:imidazoleglycerol-phosphate dehydratase/histidinol-phosphatase